MPENEPHRLTGNPKVKFGFDEQNALYFAESPGGDKRIFVSHRKRLSLYKNGINRRMSHLLSDYRIGKGLIRKGDLVVDVGANIGELGFWALRKSADYIAFEPDPMAFKALSLNAASGTLFDIGLSDKSDNATFYLDTANADSSLFQGAMDGEQVEIRIDRLDTVLAAGDQTRQIRLLKVEAEGMEPEVLRGAEETLARCEYVAVDAGPERGGDNTVPAVLRILTRAGFEAIDCYLRRGTFLFRQTA